MKLFTKRIFTFIIACALSLVSVLYFASQARAGDEPTVVVIDSFPPIPAGDSFVITGGLYRVVATGREGIPDRAVQIYLEPVSLDQGLAGSTILLAKAYSDATGHLQWTMHKTLTAGHYRIYFVFEGTPRFMKSTTVADIFIKTGLPSVNKATAPKTTPITKTVPKVKAYLNAEVPATSISVGDVATVTAHLVDRMGRAIAGRMIYFYLPDITQVQTTTLEGIATFQINRPLLPGSNMARIVFKGSETYVETETTAKIEVLPLIATQIKLIPQTQQFHVGGETSVIAQLTTVAGQPVTNKLLRFYLNGEFRFGATTDANGQATLRLPRTLVAGQHVLSTTFFGGANLLATVATLPVILLPQVFEVRTVPPLEHIQIQVGEQIIETDPSGVARLQLERAGIVSVTVLSYTSLNPAVNIQFSRWSDEVFSKTRTINLSNNKSYEIGFELSYPMKPKFVEAQTGRAVDMARLTSARIINNLGIVLELKGGESRWVTANRIIRFENSLRSIPLTYYWQRVIIDDVNVVNEGQQQFEMKPDTQIPVKLQMFHLQMQTQDALFGFPVGNGASVAYPNGVSREVTLSRDGNVRIESLARGSYTVTVRGAYGLLSPMPVSLSQDQDVLLTVITYLDIAIVGLVLGAIVLVTLAVGRPEILSRKSAQRNRLA